MCFYKVNRCLWSVFLLACISMPGGCQNLGQAMDSSKIRLGHLLLIPRQGPLHITWESRQLTIVFKGKVDQSILTVDAKIDITDGGIQNVSLLDQLLVDIYFAKSDGSVLDRQNIYSATQSTIGNLFPYTFTRSFDLPKGTTHIAFGYDGTVREVGSGMLQKKGDVSERSFQHSPFR